MSVSLVPSVVCWRLSVHVLLILSIQMFGDVIGCFGLVVSRCTTTQAHNVSKVIACLRPNDPQCDRLCTFDSPLWVILVFRLVSHCFCRLGTCRYSCFPCYWCRPFHAFDVRFVAWRQLVVHLCCHCWHLSLCVERYSVLKPMLHGRSKQHLIYHLHQ